VPFIRRIAFAIMALILVGAPMPAAAETLQHRIAQLEPHFTVSRPEGEGPFPVLIMLHGCGGPRPFLDDVAQVAVRAGAAVISVDSFAHRHISRIAAFATVCTGARLQGSERAGDLYAALAWARAQPWADARRVAAIGWSHGGWTIMDALALHSGAEMARATGISDLPDEPLEGLEAAMLVYPYTGVGTLCGRRDWRFAPRQIIAIIAQRDYIVGSSRAALERQRSHGAPMQILLFENATHAFEDEFAEDPRVRYNPQATAREHATLREMIEAL
jgi:dienelactone hydrolase